ncbi:nucleotide exchange factor GrpE, partial [Hyphomonas sp. UBA3201]
MSDETKPGETAEIDSNTSKADLKAAADDILKSAPKQEDAPEAQADVDPVQQLEIEKEELREQLLRTLADLDNTRKRAERQVSDARVYAIEKFAGDLLSV